MTYLKVISFRVSLIAESSIVPLPIFYIWIEMLPGMLFQISFLCKSFPSPLADIWLHSHMHTHVIKKIPRLK